LLYNLDIGPLTGEELAGLIRRLEDSLKTGLPTNAVRRSWRYAIALPEVAKKE
jgi:hypothetical protein